MPKAATLVAGWWPSDENEETSLQDQPLLPSLTLKGTVCLENADPSRSFALHASITENASESAAHHYGAQCWNWKNFTTEERKSQYCRDLCLQIEERKHHRERERNRDVLDEQKHNDTIQRNVWGLPGSGAPNYHLGTARRSERLRLAGILPQQQVNEAAGLSPALLQPTGAQCSQGGKEKTKKRECLQPKLCVTNEDCVSCKVLTTRKLYKPAFCRPRNKHHDIPKS
ncbi:uncharacterized protein [Clinocottus analis]|uniref:uncharacterized protein n=1 Tax=Clinocottus analis TaxID=304258 RepID=UPI0035BF23FF